jgi:TRAP-type C4-dicarboxylate transport system permease small subunit
MRDLSQLLSIWLSFVGTRHLVERGRLLKVSFVSLFQVLQNDKIIFLFTHVEVMMSAY